MIFPLKFPLKISAKIAENSPFNWESVVDNLFLKWTKLKIICGPICYTITLQYFIGDKLRILEMIRL